MSKKITIFLIIITLVFGMTYGVFADENMILSETKASVYISNEDEFIEFAKNCTLDDYSKNLKVFLRADLDLSEYEFFDIPIFLGDFDGENHTIKGLSDDLNKDYQAIFRKIETGASVSNLNLEYSRSTEQSFVGGIVATNYGTIENCKFSGVLYGKNNIAGICSVNYGYIINCKSYGGVFGETKIAGITSLNNGTVINCDNKAEINTDVSEIDFILDVSILSNINIDHDGVEVVDIGGIVGNNTGIIQSCENYGEVGYPHVGYNVGGICGIQSGYIVDCRNHANIFGRKEVGGITGQFEPYVSTVYSVSKLETLKDEINTLSELTSKFSENTKENSAVLSSDIASLTSSVETTKVYADDLLKQTENIVNSNVDSLNQVSVTVSQTIADFSAVVDSTDKIFDSLDIINQRLKASLEQLEKLSDHDTTELRNSLENASNYLNQANEGFQNAMNVELSADDMDTLIENLNLVFDYLSSASDNFAKANEEITTSFNKVLEFLGESVEIDAFIDELQSAVDEAEVLTQNIRTTTDLTKVMLDNLKNQDEIVFTKTDENYKNTSQSLSNSMSDVIDDVEKINLSLNTSVDIALEDFNSVNAQLNVVLTLLIEIIQDVSVSSAEDHFDIDDESYENIDDITAGKIANCENLGIIDGDINIGGISGSISFEYSFDMEDDYKDKTQTSTKSGFAVIVDCENSGDVTAKSDCVGGIVGLQDFGYITKSSSMTCVESVNGNYVGGIVGNSTAMINSCYSKCNLSGMMYVGGVVGSGVMVKNSYSMPQITATKGNIGGIAGDLTADGTIENNFFVGDNLGGLNGISYLGKAQSISHKELITHENIVNIFENVNVRFYIDNEVVCEISKQYGSNISENELPKISSKDGFYAVWEDFEMQNIAHDLKVNAKYIPLVTTLASKEKENELSVVLVQGIYEDEKLKVEISTDEKDMPKYMVEVVGENTKINKIRYLIQENNAEIEICKENSWQRIEAIKDGKYLVFDVSNLNNSKIKFRVIENRNFPIWLICVVLLLLITTVIFFIRKKYYKNK